MCDRFGDSRDLLANVHFGKGGVEFLDPQVHILQLAAHGRLIVSNLFNYPSCFVGFHLLLSLLLLLLCCRGCIIVCRSFHLAFPVRRRIEFGVLWL